MIKRPLAEFEVQRMGFGISMGVKYVGLLDEGALRKAFQVLCQRHAVLRSIIRVENSEYVLCLPSIHYPPVISLRGDERSLKDLAAGPWYPHRELAQLILVAGENEGYVSLRVDHAVVDGAAIGAIIFDLWQIYTDIVEGRDIVLDVSDRLPISPTELLMRRWRRTVQATAPARPDACLELGDSRPQIVIGTSLERHILFDEGSTNRMRLAARSLGTSIHGLICGCIIAAQRNHSSLKDAALMECRSVVDLRPRVTPPVGPTETTNFTVHHSARLLVHPDDDPLRVGREIKRKIDDSIASRELSFDAHKYAEDTDSALEGRLATAVVSNIGAIKAFELPAGLKIVDFVRHDQNQALVPFPVYGAVTFNGCLKLICLYSDRHYTDYETKLISDRINHELLRVSADESADIGFRR